MAKRRRVDAAAKQILGTVITIRRITESDAALLRDVRLRALSDAPMAFGSTYAREAAFDSEEWQRRAKRAGRGSSAAMFLAFESGIGCGIIGCFAEERSAGPGLYRLDVGCPRSPAAGRRKAR